MLRLPSSLAILLLLISSLVVFPSAASAAECERLKATLTYTQEQAPRDLSSVVRNTENEN